MAANSFIRILQEVIREAGKQIWVRPPIKRGNKPIQQLPVKDFVKKAIENSIENRWLLNIYYEGDAENAPGRRWIEPYVWGKHVRTDNDVLRAYQYQGKSSTITSGWKLFRLDRIRNTAPLTTKHFDAARSGYHAQDKHMSSIIKQVDFGSRPSEPEESGEDISEGLEIYLDEQLIDYLIQKSENNATQETKNPAPGN